MKIIQSPVQAVEIEMNVPAVMAEATHRILDIRGILVTGILGPLPLCMVSAVIPGIVQSGIEHECIKYFSRSLPEERIVELRGSVRLLELQPHRQLVGLPAARAAAAGKSHNRVNMKLALRIVGIEKFHGDGSFGFLVVLVFPIGMRIDTIARTKPMVHVHDQRHRGDSLEVLSDRAEIQTYDHPVHLVIGASMPPCIRKAGPVLPSHVGWKDIGLRIHVRRQQITLIGHRS